MSGGVENLKQFVNGLLVVIFFIIYINVFNILISYTIGGFWSGLSTLIGTIIVVVASIILGIVTKEKVVEIIKG
ncbi:MULTISPECIES: hypothetical protein [Bacillaceae]|uniref:Uncharacterized protein n=1 Tax=Evansella alkalicola TaxID=745819 RepID=A0ABS6JQN7_9BACI|nr:MULTISPECIES: hypothetical protein [Bacillaceae]MBU9720866.1 hypothetical protein [Bacillus alkalicola]